MSENDVVQFNENHKWAGCFGIITKVKKCEDGISYLVRVPIAPDLVTSIYATDEEIEYIGKAILV